MKRLFAILLLLALVFSFVACGDNTQQETTEATTEATTQHTEKELTEEEKILMERRDTVEQYMRENTVLLWRAGEDITYLAGGTNTVHIEAGKLYKGVPYSFAGNSTASFLDYASEPDENGICTISGVTATALQTTADEEVRLARLGNDCSAAVLLAWSQISDSITARNTSTMFPKYGVIPVGDYELEIEGDTMEITGEVIMKNGREKIYAAYAQAQKGDALVKTRAGRNHAVMVVSVNTVYNEDGTINEKDSYITCLEQSRNFFGTTYEDEKLGETVHVICGEDMKYTFSMLVRDNYIPITCKELVDASAVAAEPAVTDSETQWSKENILSGTLTCSRDMDKMTLTITDSTGSVVQEASVHHPDRWQRKIFELQQFTTENPETLMGSLDLDALAVGTYHCTVVCRLTTGQELTARDFDFTV